MPRILIINPNTSESVTERVQAACRQAHPNLHWEAAAARGPFAVVTGGAAWGPMLQRFARMQAQVPAPLLDSVLLGAAAAAQLVGRCAHGPVGRGCAAGRADPSARCLP
jgi:Asp/Glu/hydantoin racemase